MSTTIDAPEGEPREPLRRRRIVKIGVLAGIAAVLLAGAAAVLILQERHPPVHVSGRVTGPSGSEEEAPTATVSTETDADGRFAIDVAPASPESWYRLTAQKPGFTPIELDPVDPDGGPVALAMAASPPPA